MDSNGNCNCNCLSKKGIGQGKGREGIERWVFFSCCLILLLFFLLTLFNAGQLISYQDQVNCWTDFSCKDISSSRPNLVITFLFSNYKVRVNCGELLYLALAGDRDCKLFKVIPPHLILVARICVCIIIGSLERFIDALRQVDWFHIKLSSSSQLLDGLLLPDFSPVIKIWSSHFCWASIVWESTVANSCIWNWN